jgi:hypothetical protein
VAVRDATDWRAEARAAAVRNGVDPDVFTRLIETESSFDPGAVSEKGAIGLGQLMPDTARDLGVDPRKPKANLDASAKYLKKQLDTFGDYTLAAAAYNAGPQNVKLYGGVPPFPETQDYVAKVAGGAGRTPGTAGRTVVDLGRAVKLKYPSYRNVPDAELGRAVRKKFPAYRGFSDVPVDTAEAVEQPAAADLTVAPSHKPTVAAPGEGDGSLRGHSGVQKGADAVLRRVRRGAAVADLQEHGSSGNPAAPGIR